MITLNTNIMFGENTFSRLPKMLKEYGFYQPGILCDINVYNNSEYVAKQIDRLLPHQKNLIFYDSPFEPSYQLLDIMMEEIKEKRLDQKVDVWIGIGGGSALDTVKALAILCKNKGPSLKYKGFPIDLNSPLPIVAVPSTTGTGSEVVFNASFIDEGTKIKMGINYDKNYPILVILDPHIPSGAPIKVLASSGCDALVHSLESFMSIKSNEQVRFFSKQAYKLIVSNMVPLLKGHGNIENWQNMQWAAVYAMFALSNSTSGPTGALSYYLGSNFKVNHGVAGAVFIAKVVNYNHKNGYHDLSLLYEGQDKYKLNPEEKSRKIIQEIEELLELANIPHALDVFGVQKSDHAGFNKFAKQAKAAFDFNPVLIDLHHVSDLFID